MTVDKEKYRQKKVAAYCRVSTDSEEQLVSYANQKKVYTEMIASRKDWCFAGLFADEGKSGTRADKRPEFNKMINKFFSYSQVVFNKHIVISEWMAEYVIDWMQKHHAIFPNGKTLESWAKGSGQSEEYLNFTDNMFWAALSRILYDDLSDLVPHHIKTFCTYLLRHMEPDFLDEKRIITSDEAEAKSLLKSSEIVKNEAVRCQRIAILSKKRSLKP